MKKIVSFFFFLVCVWSLVFSASAVIVNDEKLVDTYAVKSLNVVDLSKETYEATYTVYASETTEDQQLFVTNTKKINIKVKGDKKAVIKVVLYDTDGNRKGEETKEIGSITSTKWTFGGLTQSSKYYYVIRNLDQRDIEVAVKVTD